MFDVFWVLFGVVVLGGGFFALGYPLCVCVCARAHVAWRIWCIYRREKNILTNEKSYDSLSRVNTARQQ